MRKSKPTKCGKCGGNNPPFTLFANATTAESYALCINCMSSQSTTHLNDLAEIDALIEEQEDMLGKMEAIVQEAGDMDISPELNAFAFTPLKTYKMIQMTLASLKTKRVELLSKGENEVRLQFELNKKIEEEKYEEASKLQKRLDKLKIQPKDKRKSIEGIKQEKPKNLFASDEEAAGRCIRCKDRFPKPPGLFNDFDIGNCHDMCLSCCAYEVPEYVQSVEMADQMITEMERFSGMMIKMSLLGRLMRENDAEMDFDAEMATLQNKHAPECQLMLTRLNYRKEVLLNPSKKENPLEEIEPLINLFNNILGDDKDLLKALVKSLDEDHPSFSKPQSVSKKKKTKTEKKKKVSFSPKVIINKTNAWLKAAKEKSLCPECNEQPVKPDIIFEDYDLGECDKLCLVCSMVQLPLAIKSIEMAENMMEEMQGISDCLDEFLVIHELNEAGEIEKAKQINIKEMEIEAKIPEQVIARNVLEAIQLRKTFLSGIGEDEELRGLTDNFIRILGLDKNED